MKRAAVPSILVAVVLLAVAGIVEAQQPKKVRGIGFLASGSPFLYLIQPQGFPAGAPRIRLSKGCKHHH